jgi:hypothetical protein
MRQAKRARVWQWGQASDGPASRERGWLKVRATAASMMHMRECTAHTAVEAWQSREEGGGGDKEKRRFRRGRRRTREGRRNAGASEGEAGVVVVVEGGGKWWCTNTTNKSANSIHKHIQQLWDTGPLSMLLVDTPVPKQQRLTNVRQGHTRV